MGRAEALDVYERSRQALARDLGLRPGAELQRLSGDIVRHDPRLALLPHTAEATPRERRTLEVVGPRGPRRFSRRGVLGSTMRA